MASLADGKQEWGARLAAVKWQVPVEDCESAGRTPLSRGNEGAQPGRI